MAKESIKKDEVKSAVAAKQENSADVVKVVPLVNMILLDGSHFEIGKPCVISLGEFDRLKKDARGPFWKE